MNYTVERINAPKLKLGEGPHWDVETQSLYFVDIGGKTINCYKYNEKKTYSAAIGMFRLKLIYF